MTLRFFPLLLAAMLLVGCSSGISGTYKEQDGRIVLTLNSDGTCSADHGSTIIGGKYRVEGEKVLFQWDNGEADGAKIDGDALVAHGKRLVKQ